MKVYTIKKINDENAIKYKYAYHGAKTEEAANNILDKGFKGNRVFLTEDVYTAEGYGKYIIKVDISSLKLYQLTDEDLDNSDYSPRNGYDGIIYRYGNGAYNVEVFNVNKLNRGKRVLNNLRNTIDLRTKDSIDLQKFIDYGWTIERDLADKIYDEGEKVGYKKDDFLTMFDSLAEKIIQGYKKYLVDARNQLIKKLRDLKIDAVKRGAKISEYNGYILHLGNYDIKIYKNNKLVGTASTENEAIDRIDNGDFNK